MYVDSYFIIIGSDLIMSTTTTHLINKLNRFPRPNTWLLRIIGILSDALGEAIKASLVYLLSKTKYFSNNCNSYKKVML